MKKTVGLVLAIILALMFVLSAGAQTKPISFHYHERRVTVRHKGIESFTHPSYPGYRFVVDSDRVYKGIAIDKFHHRAMRMIYLSKGKDSIAWLPIDIQKVLCDKMATPPMPMQSPPVTIPGIVPSLQSLPGCPYVLYMNFSGGRIYNINWCDTAFTCAAAQLTTAQIIETWARVAEKYRLFNVNITTDSNVYNAAKYKGYCMITPTWQWYGELPGGVSFVGAGWNLIAYNPCFSFTTGLANTPQYIAEATAHEFGHLIPGFIHHGQFNSSCVNINQYNQGHGSGINGWAPIMGSGYGFQWDLWADSATTAATCYLQPQHDYKQANSNGLTYRVDDIGNNINTARAETIINNSFSDSGVITPGDTDVLKISTTGGSLTVNVNPWSWNGSGTCLLPKMVIKNSAGQIISIDTPNTIGITRTITGLPSGSYYVFITGRYLISWLDYGYKLIPTAGQFYITGTITQTAQPPVIQVNNSSICKGQTTTLIVSGGSSYSWTPGTGLSATSGATILASPTVTTTYTIVGTGSNGLSGSTTSIVTINPPPTITTSPSSQTISAGKTAQIVASGASVYSWSPTGLTGSDVTVSPAISTTYTVTGTSSTGCTSTSTAIVDVTTTSCATPVTTLKFNTANRTSALLQFPDNGACSYTGTITPAGGIVTIQKSSPNQVHVTGLKTQTLYTLTINGGVPVQFKTQ
jgi:hypothetical protein